MDLEKNIVAATLEVFASMIFIDITPEFPVDHSDSEVEADVFSLIGLAGDLKGILAIQCPAEVAQAVTGAMLGMEMTELGEDVKDAIGEIANMVAGGLKVALAETGKKIELAIPSTVIGKAIRTSGLSGATRTKIRFASPLGCFAVELRYIFS